MGNMIELTASDGHTLSAYQATPDAKPLGAVIILQEVFGVTAHIKRIAEGYASQGFLAIAPGLFDRSKPGVTVPYSDVERGRALMMSLNQDQVILDIAAALTAAKTAGKVGVVGYCWGGAIADLAACRLDIDAAVAYYGRMIIDWIDEQPRCPVLYHFGAQDPLIPPELVEQITAGRSEHTIYVYEDAGHGFNCEEREEFDPASAALALERSLEFFEKNLR